MRSALPSHSPRHHLQSHPNPLKQTPHTHTHAWLPVRERRRPHPLSRARTHIILQQPAPLCSPSGTPTTVCGRKTAPSSIICCRDASACALSRSPVDWIVESAGPFFLRLLCAAGGEPPLPTMKDTTRDAREGRSLLSLLWPDCERDWRDVREDHQDDLRERAESL